MGAGNPHRQRQQAVNLFKVTGNAEVAKKVIEHQKRFEKLLGELKDFREWVVRQVTDPDLTLDARTAYQRTLDFFDNKPVSDRHKIADTPTRGVPEE